MTPVAEPCVSGLYASAIACGLQRGCSCSSMGAHHLPADLLFELTDEAGRSPLPALSTPGSGMRSQQDRAAGSVSQPRQRSGGASRTESSSQGRAPALARVSCRPSEAPKRRQHDERTRSRKSMDEARGTNRTYGTPPTPDIGDPTPLIPRRLSKSAFDVRTASVLTSTGGRCLVRTDSSSSRRRSCNASLPPQLIAISDYLAGAKSGQNSNSSTGGASRSRRLSTTASRGFAGGVNGACAGPAVGCNSAGGCGDSRITSRNGRRKSSTVSGDSFSAGRSCPPSPLPGRQPASRSFGCGQGEEVARGSLGSSGVAAAPGGRSRVKAAVAMGNTPVVMQLSAGRRSCACAQQMGGSGYSERSNSGGRAGTEESCVTGRRSDSKHGKPGGLAAVARSRVAQKWAALKSSVAAAFSPLGVCVGTPGVVQHAD